MSVMFDLEGWRQTVATSFNQLGVTVAGFLPRLVGALLILALGWLASKAIEMIANRTLTRLGLDRAAERLQVSENLRGAGFTSRPSEIAARLLFWFLMLIFVVSAVQTLGLTAATATIDRLIAYVPNLVVALLVLIIGTLFARFARNVVTSGAAAAQFPQPVQLGMAVQGIVVILVAVLALEEIGVDTKLFVTVITAVVATLGLTMGIAFALGARTLVTHILAGHYLRQTLESGKTVEVGGRRGAIERVGAVDTLFRDGERSWSMPNAALLEQTIDR